MRNTSTVKNIILDPKRKANCKESNRKIPAVQKIKGLSYPPPKTNLTELRVTGRRELESTGDDLYGSVHTKIY